MRGMNYTPPPISGTRKLAVVLIHVETLSGTYDW